MLKLIILAALALLLASACNGGYAPAPKAPTAPTAPAAAAPSATATAATPAADIAPATLEGTLTVDGAPLDAKFLGARVLRDGLSAACQDAIPSVTAGQYQIPVTSDALVRGCGAPG